MTLHVLGSDFRNFWPQVGYASIGDDDIDMIDAFHGEKLDCSCCVGWDLLLSQEGKLLDVSLAKPSLADFSSGSIISSRVRNHSNLNSKIKRIETHLTPLEIGSIRFEVTVRTVASILTTNKHVPSAVASLASALDVGCSGSRFAAITKWFGLRR